MCQGGAEETLSCSVQEYMWQKDLVTIALFIDECLDKIYVSAAGQSLDGQASDQPDALGGDVKL